MSRREDIVNDIWEDEPFADLSGPAQHIYVWSWTNALCNMAGLYKTRRQLIGAGKWDDETLTAALDELARAQMMFFESPWLWNRSRAKRLASKSPMMARSVAKDIAKVPADNSLRGAFLAHYSDDPWLRETLAPLVQETFHVDQLPLSTPSREGLDTFPTPPPESQKERPSGDLPEKVHRTGTGIRTTEPSEETDNHTRPRATLTYRGKRVPAETAAHAERLLDAFNDATGRDLAAAPNLRQIAGALLERPDIPIDRWARAITNTIANPPAWVEGPIQIGHIFGDKAADHALANTGRRGSSPVTAGEADREHAVKALVAELLPDSPPNDAAFAIEQALRAHNGRATRDQVVEHIRRWFPALAADLHQEPAAA